MEKLNKEILIIDGNSLLYRSYHGTAFTNNILRTSTGVPINAIHAFITSLSNVLQKHNFTHVFVALDKGKNTFRHKKYEGYKAGRSKTPDELFTQMLILREFFDAAGIKYYEDEEYEADDIIGTLAKFYSADKENNIFILSGDHDLWQVISENVFIIDPSDKDPGFNYLNDERLYKKSSLYPYQVPDYKGIAGDSSDNIKGIPGVGDTWAKKLLNEYKTLDGIYENINNIERESIRNKFIEFKDEAYFCKDLATIFYRIENIEISNSVFKFDREALTDFFRKYELKKVASMFDIDISNKNQNFNEKIDFTILNDWDVNIKTEEAFIFVWFDNEDYHKESTSSFSIVTKENKHYYFEVEGLEENQLDLLKKDYSNFYNFLLNTKISTYDSKSFLYFLLKKNIDINNLDISFDFSIASYLINSNSKQSFENSVKNIDPSVSVPNLDSLNKKKFDISLNDKANMLVHCSLVLKNLKEKTIDMLKNSNQLDLYNKLELPFSKSLALIEFSGVQVDKEELTKQSIDIESRLNDVIDKIKNILGNLISDDFNIASPKQLSDLLFNKLKLKNSNKNSTDKETLETLENDHEVISYILVYRKLSKTLNTYLRGLEKYLDEDSYIRTKYNQTLTATGRLSSSEPNMQNLSVNDDDQKQIRKIFVCDKNESFISFDYSQIELRVVSDMSNEQYLIKAFNEGGDIHKETAKKLFNLNSDDVKPSHRKVAKTVNFGILYGQSNFGLSKELGLTVAEADKIINDYKKAYPNVIAFLDNQVEFAKKNGYVLTMGNRRRYIPEINNSNKNIQRFGYRIAMNSPIQGTAADILKVAIINIQENIKDIKFDIVAQIHDEIIIRTNKENVDKLSLRIKEIMNQSFALLSSLLNQQYKTKVKLEVNACVGNNWYELK